MEKYLVSARKYRPSTFASVVGQKALTATLKNSIATDRLAHAYLFCGSRGVGKTSCARIFAKTINCEHPTADGEACNECHSCRSFNEGRSLNIIELDAASNNGVDDMRSLVEQVQVPPTDGRYRVFIIDEVHMLSTGAFNAFLKTLEEPPSYVIFILATTEKHKIIPTILSRCQIYDFNRITIDDMIDHLAYVAGQEGITAERSALNVIARKADGAMRDALSIFDQVAASSRGDITYASTVENLNVLDADYYSRLLDAFLSGNVADSLLIYHEIRDHGFDAHFFITGLADYFRDLMVARDPRTKCLLETSDEQREVMATQAQRCQPQFLFRAMDLCNQADLNFRVASNKQFLVELTLIKLCQSDSPSHNNSGGEGQLKPVGRTEPTVVPQPQAAPSAVGTASRQAPLAAPASAPVSKPVVARQSSVSIAAALEPSHVQASPKRMRTSLGPGVSINGRKSDSGQVSEPVASYHATQAVRSNPYTDVALDGAWQSYIAGHPEAQVLIHTMQTCRPRRLEPDLYLVMVESQIQLDQLHDALPVLLAHIHNQLANDNIKLRLAVNEGEGSPLTWTDGEVFAHILESNPAVKALTEQLKLTLE